MSSPDRFRCPLRSPVLQAPVTLFPSYAAANRAVVRYQTCAGPTATRVARRMYLRHLPLVRKALARFCKRSGCWAGQCLPEELVGETYPLFRQTLDEYDPDRGVDFTGYASRRLFWGLEHHARKLRHAEDRSGPEIREDTPADEDPVDERVLAHATVEAMLERLDPQDAELLLWDAAGFTRQEMANAVGITNTALRTRLARARQRLRAAASPH